MGLNMPKIPDAQEIANMTADAMQPMMDKLDELVGLMREQNELLRRAS